VVAVASAGVAVALAAGGKYYLDRKNLKPNICYTERSTEK